MTARPPRVRAPGPRGDAGFSLVETAVLLALLGVLAALALPALRGTLPRVRLRNNTAVLADEIALARRLALAQGVDYSIAFDTAAEAYTLRKREGGAWRSLGTSRVNGTDIASVTGFASADTLVARAGGTMNVPASAGGVANYGYITLQTPDGSRRSRIRVEPLGRVVPERSAGF